RRTDERVSLPILLVARLLADQHQLRVPRAFTKYRLRGVEPQPAPATPRRGHSQLGKRGVRRDEVSGGTSDAAGPHGHFFRRASGAGSFSSPPLPADPNRGAATPPLTVNGGSCCSANRAGSV